jgi:tetratricopeptide (TPR) repeat protein
MKNLNFRILIFIITSILITAEVALGQSVRSLNNSGVDSYKKQQFVDAEVNFKKGLEKSKESYELNYNLGDAYYKQQRYDEAIKSFQNSLAHTEDGMMKSKAFHNIGNSLLKSQKIKESVEAYKNSLKLNPDDKDTKYNLSYALSLLKQQQDQQQNKNQNDKNQDNKDQKDQNKNDQQNKNKDDQKDQKQDQQKEQNKDQTAQQDKLKQPEKDKISKEEAERILQALKNNEKDLQKKLRKKVGVPITTDKDW